MSIELVLVAIMIFVLLAAKIAHMKSNSTLLARSLALALSLSLSLPVPLSLYVSVSVSLSSALSRHPTRI